MFTVTAGDLPLFGTDSDGVLWGVEDVDGWGVTASTASQTQRPRQGGAWSGGKYPKARAVTVSGSFTAPSPEAAQAALDRLGAAVSRYEFVLSIVETTSARWGLFYQTGELIPVWTSPTDVEWSFQVASDDWRKFGQAVTSSTTLPSTTGGLTISTTSYEWDGDANYSQSVMRYDGVEVRRNYATRPQLENGNNVGNRVTQRRATEWSTSGGASVELDPTGTSSDTFLTLTAAGLTAGKLYTLSADIQVPVRHSGAYRARRIVVYNAVETTVESGQEPNVVGSTSRHTVTFTAPADPSTLILRLYNGSQTPGEIVRWDSPVLVEAGKSTAFFDGASQGGGGLTVPFTINAKTVTGQVSLVNPGNDSGPVRLRIDGPCVGPVVTHISTGAQLTFASSLTLRDGEWLEVDMEARTVLANGQSSRSGWVTSRGWSQFDPGVNTWSFTAASFTSAARLTVTATPSWK